MNTYIYRYMYIYICIYTNNIYSAPENMPLVLKSNYTWIHINVYVYIYTYIHIYSTRKDGVGAEVGLYMNTYIYTYIYLQKKYM